MEFCRRSGAKPGSDQMISRVSVSMSIEVTLHVMRNALGRNGRLLHFGLLIHAALVVLEP